MTIEQLDVVDFIGVEKYTNKVILTISDHLDWEKEEEHLHLMQRKINAYINFIESGELCETVPRFYK